MPHEPIPIARVRLARSLVRLLAVPAASLVAGGVALAAGTLLGGLTGIGLAIAGLVAAASGVLLAGMLMSLRLEVEVGGVRVRWWGGERRYPLVRGPVTRVATRGPNAPRLRVRFGALGWGFGPGLLRDSERVEVVRLAPDVRLILLPTVHGRLAVAPSVEQDLLDALAAAARVQQRLDANVMPVRPAGDRPAAIVKEPVLRRELPEAPVAEPPRAPSPRLLTGIERALLEERLAAERERRAAEAARQAELELAARRAAQEAAALAAAGRLRAPGAPSAPGRRRRERARWRRPTWLRLPSFGAAASEVGADAVSTPPIAVPARAQPAVRLPSLASAGLILLPTAIAGAVWLVVDTWATPPAAEIRQLVMALVLAGPAASLASIATWLAAPRLTRLPLIAGVTALVLVGRALWP